MKKNISKKSIILTLTMAATLVVAALLAWWLWPKNYEEMIPAQAKAVVRIQPAKLQKEVGNIPNPLKSVLGIEANGIDFSQPLYAFVTPNEYIGFVAKVENEEAIETQINKLVAQKQCQPTEEYDNLHWTWLSSGWLMAWNSRMAMALGPGVAQEKDMLRQTITSMVNSSDCFTKTAAYNQLKKQEGSIQLFAQLDAMPTPYNMLFRLSVPADCDPATIQVFASAQINKDSTIINSQITSENEDIVNAINAFEKEKGCIRIANPALCDSTLFVMATSTQGKQLLQLLKTDATLRGLLMGLNQTIDADRMLGSTQGVFTMEISTFAKDWTPTFCLKAETSANNLFADANYWMESAKKQKNVVLKRTSAEAFFLSNDKQQLNFGKNATNNALYFTSPSLINRAAQPFIAQKNNEPQGTLVYFHVNLNKLFAQPCMNDGAMKNILKTILPGSHAITYKAETGRKASISIK